jgi:hypothetical protein
MASLEGLGLQAPSWPVSAKSGECRAFRVPLRQGPGWRSGSSLSRGHLPVECCGSRRHCSPRLPIGASPCRPPRLGRLTGPVVRFVGDDLATVPRCHGWLPSPGLRQSAQSTATARARQTLPHARVGQPSEPLDEDRERDALDRVHVDHTAAGYRVLAGLEADFTDEAADRRGAWCDECAPVPGITASRERTTTPPGPAGAAADGGVPRLCAA